MVDGLPVEQSAAVSLALVAVTAAAAWSESFLSVASSYYASTLVFPASTTTAALTLAAALLLTAVRLSLSAVTKPLASLQAAEVDKAPAHAFFYAATSAA